MPKRSRTARISIDIGEYAVNIIKTNGYGTIRRVGSAELPVKMPDATSSDYAAVLAYAIIKAAKSAGIRGGKDCVMVVGSPQIITRIFVWPEMPPDALLLNAETEIAHYLPSGIENFILDLRILRRRTSKPAKGGKSAAQLDVMVAAIAADFVKNLLSAAKMSGFKPSRIDIKENAREKLVGATGFFEPGKACAKPDAGGFTPRKRVQDKRRKDGIAQKRTGSFAVLNAAGRLVDMTVFINGMFYASRYFGSHLNAVVPVSVNADAAEKGEDSAYSSLEDVDALVTEIASVIDYIQYRERGLEISDIFILGEKDVTAGISQSLSEHLAIPVHSPYDSLKTIFKTGKRQNVAYPCFLDAYGAALSAHGLDINLKPKKKKRYIFGRIILPVLCLLLALFSIAIVGIYLPHMRVQELERENQKLEQELVRYNIPEDIGILQQEVSRARKRLEEAESFTPTAGVSEILNAVYRALPPNGVVHSVSVGEGGARIAGSADTLGDVSELIAALRSDGTFGRTNPQMVYSYTLDNEGEVAVDFEITLTLARAED